MFKLPITRQDWIDSVDKIIFSEHPIVYISELMGKRMVKVIIPYPQVKQTVVGIPLEFFQKLTKIRNAPVVQR